jgi:hypothetical protein
MKQKRGFENDRTGFLLCPAELDWNDPEYECPYSYGAALPLLTISRIRRQLRSKELTVTGSHWPIFVYRDEKYDPENPWKGLFRNEILVKVSENSFVCTEKGGLKTEDYLHTRVSSIFLRAPVLSMTNLERRALEMPDCTA